MGLAAESIVYSIERLDDQGRPSRSTVIAGSPAQPWVVRTEVDGVHRPEQTHEAPTLEDLISRLPALHEVRSGVTWIVVDGVLSMHRLLDTLRVIDPSTEPEISSAWELDGQLPDLLNDFAIEDEELAARPLSSELEVLPRWIRINGARAVVVRRTRRAAVLLLDENCEPEVTDPAFDWGFYGESGGPCIWDGGARTGHCGSRLWVQHRWGDVEPERVVAWAPSRSALVPWLVDVLTANGWELPFLRAVVPFVGLTAEERASVEAAGELDGQWLVCSLDEPITRRVLLLLTRRHAYLRPAVHALAHPRAERGRVVYGWLRAIAHHRSGASWREVDNALLGESSQAPVDDDDDDDDVSAPPTPTVRFVACERRGTHLTLAECWMCQGDVLAGRATKREVLARKRTTTST